MKKYTVQADFFCGFVPVLACCGCFGLGVAGGAILTGTDAAAEADDTALPSSSAPGCSVRQINEVRRECTKRPQEFTHNLNFMQISTPESVLQQFMPVIKCSVEQQSSDKSVCGVQSRQVWHRHFDPNLHNRYSCQLHFS